MKITRKSPVTGKVNEMEIDVTEEQILAWKSGAMIQAVMPTLTDDEREFIMTGLTPEDWDMIFGKGLEEQDEPE